MSSTVSGPRPSWKSMLTVTRGDGAGEIVTWTDRRAAGGAGVCALLRSEPPRLDGGGRGTGGVVLIVLPSQQYPVPTASRAAERDDVRHPLVLVLEERGLHRAPASALLAVVIEVAEGVEADPEIASQDARLTVSLSVAQRASEAACVRQRGGAVDQEERDPVRARSAVLPLVEAGDDTGAGGNWPVVENRSRGVVPAVGELQIAIGSAPDRRNGSHLILGAARDVRGPGRRDRVRARAGQACLPLHAEVGIGDEAALERLVDQRGAAASLGGRGDGKRHECR